MAVGVLEEARYYLLDELEERMNIIPSISALVVKENHRAQFPEYDEVGLLFIPFTVQPW